MFHMFKIVKPYLSQKRSIFFSFTINSLDLTVATYLGMIYKICLIMDQPCAASVEGWLDQRQSFTDIEDGAPLARAVHIAT